MTKWAAHWLTNQPAKQVTAGQKKNPGPIDYSE